MMQSEKLIHIQTIPDTHYFSYKEKLYPIKYDFFKYSSKYFQDNEIEIKGSKILQLIEQSEDGGINLTENSIQCFIDFVHNKSITLNDENVSELNYLSRKYMVNTLMQFTNEYIEDHQKDLILPILLCRQYDSQFETEIYEDILSNNFFDYIKDKRLLDLKFQILYRIICKYTKSDSYIASSDFVDFLFSCLDKFGRDASILFSNFDIYKSGTKY